MKGLLEIPEMKIKFEMNNVSFQQYMMVSGHPIGNNTMMVEKYTSGKPIVFVSANMPLELRTEIDELIKSYCNY